MLLISPDKRWEIILPVVGKKPLGDCIHGRCSVYRPTPSHLMYDHETSGCQSCT